MNFESRIWNAGSSLVIYAAGCLTLFSGSDAAGAIAPTAAAAQDPDFTKMSLEDLGAFKVPTVVGASKHQQKVTEAPSAVSIVTGDEIKKQGHRTLGDILRGVRGIYVTYDRGYNAIGMRGVNRPGDYGGRVLITIDGQRINDPIYDTAASNSDFLLDVDLIDRVEVIRGPGSSLYGNNAFFGVINIVTRKGHDVKNVEVAGSYGSFDTYTGRISYGNTFTNGVELLVSGSILDSAGDRRLYFPEFAAINNGFAENVDGGQARSAFASLSWKGLSLEGGYVHREKIWPTAPYSAPGATVIFNDPSFQTIDERAFANIKLDHTFENEVELTARVYFDHYLFDAQYPYDYSDPLQPVFLNADVGQSESVGIETQASRTFFEKHRITLGAEERYDFQLDQQNFDLSPPTTYLNSRESSAVSSVYLQDEFQARNNLIFNGGLRYDYFQTFGGTLNPRVGVIYQPWTPTTLKFLYGQAYRAPNAYETFYQSISNKRNPGLEPERISSYELVWEQQWTRHWDSSVSLFYNDIKDLIGYEQDPSDGLFRFANLDAVVSRGFELEVNARWANGLMARASYTYANTEDSLTKQRLSNSPEHLAKVSFSAPLFTEKLFASFEVQAMSERKTARGSDVEAVWLANVTLFSRELLKGLEISASVYNLFDQRFADPVSNDFAQNAIEQDGRGFRAKVTYKF